MKAFVSFAVAGLLAAAVMLPAQAADQEQQIGQQVYQQLLRKGEIIQVVVNFTAHPNGFGGFYWQVAETGPVRPYKSMNPAKVFQAKDGWYSQCGLSLFSADGDGIARFTIKITKGDLDGKGMINGLTIMSEVLCAEDARGENK